jgi:Anti-sigma-K factor rskA
MNCEELESECLSYALGIAEEPERSEIAQHLGRNCPECVPAMQKALETVVKMSGAVRIQEPPARLRSRVIALVSPQMRPRSRAAIFTPWAIAAVLAMVLIYVGVIYRPHLPKLAPEANTTTLEQALSILSDPALEDASFGPPATRGRVFVSPNRGIIFIGANLPRLDTRTTFELWVIPKSGNPIPAGTFRSDGSTAVYVQPAPAPNAAAVAVTVEPLGGSPQPTTTPFIVVKL